QAAPLQIRAGVAEPASDVFGVVGEDDVGAGAGDAGDEFEDGAFFVEPVVGGGGFDHGVFAADVVGADGDVEFFADATDDVEIWERGLDHHHVGAFFDVERDFFEGFAGVGGIHLVATA